MSVAYKPVIWNRSKLVYDAFLLACVVAYLLVYIKLGPLLQSSLAVTDWQIVRMRAFGSCAFLMLTVILAIGPLARLDRRFLPLLYNRRHFGVMTAIVAATHAAAVLDWYFAYSPTPKLVGLLTANTSFAALSGFPFEVFGIVALAILTVMAITSHDFWLNFLTPPVWKGLHMGVYLAYAAVVLHVAFGSLQDARNPLLAILVGLCVAFLSVLHLWAGRREVAADARGSAIDTTSGWLDFGPVDAIPEARAVIGCAPGGERIAVFRFKGRLAAISNVCSHQNGPVGEGKVVLGFITCPWHGYQYRLEDGCSPPPFKERIRKYEVALAGAQVMVNPVPRPLGEKIAPLPIPAELLGPVAPAIKPAAGVADMPREVRP